MSSFYRKLCQFDTKLTKALSIIEQKRSDSTAGRNATRGDDYQAMAEEYFWRAREAESDNDRQDYLELARIWLEAASRADYGAPFLSLPSRCWR